MNRRLFCVLVLFALAIIMLSGCGANEKPVLPEGSVNSADSGVPTKDNSDITTTPVNTTEAATTTPPTTAETTVTTPETAAIVTTTTPEATTKTTTTTKPVTTTPEPTTKATTTTPTTTKKVTTTTPTTTKKVTTTTPTTTKKAATTTVTTEKPLTTLKDSKIGTEDGYDYELWKDYGDTVMVLTGGGTFTCEWKNINNALFRRGKKFNSTQTYHDLGSITVDFEVDYRPNGNSYLCIYGWTKDPLVEYYIVESWGNWRPPGGDPIATITVDGGVYDVYVTDRYNQPSIVGTTTFKQYWSVRREKRTSGTVDVSAHFAEWEKLGLEMGKMYEVALTVEGYQSSGSAKVVKNVLTIGEKTY